MNLIIYFLTIFIIFNILVMALPLEFDAEKIDIGISVNFEIISLLIKNDEKCA